MSHPNAVALEAFALGEKPAGAAEHVASCEACRAYVERVRAELGAATEAPPREVVVRIEDAARRERGRRVRAIGAVVVPFAVAAALLLVLKRPVSPEATLREAGPARASSELAMATPEPSADEPTVYTLQMAKSDPETRFKGGLTTAVVRERGGNQARFTRSVGVRSGDRLRLEVALDRTEAILAAVLGDDGSWLELMPEGTRDAGTHLSERSARVDATPTGGVILVGPPEAVRRARVTHDTTGLSSLRVDVEAP